MTLDITVVIPTIPQRPHFLHDALESVKAQTLQPVEIIVEHARDNEGPAFVRNRAVEKVTTDFIAFLDDDDWLLPDHLEKLAALQEQEDADIVWPWFEVHGGTDPFPQHRGRQWNPQDPHQIPITVLLRTEAFNAVGGFVQVGDGPTDPHGNRAGEDWELWLALNEAGYKFAHTPDITWVWRHHSKNTSGLPERR